jgi:hypothetical protein
MKKMSLQSKQTELDETKPDRLAFAILLIGILSICIVANPWIILFYIYYKTIPLITLPFFLLGGIGIVYGAFKTVRGSARTKQFVNALLGNFGIGAIAGFVTVLVVYIFIANSQLENTCLLSDVIGSIVFFGTASGGFGGLILGNKWKNKKAAFIGGVVAVVILAALVFAFFHSVACVYTETISP